MASTLTVNIENGEATVIADGTKLSCAVAHDVERALGKVTKTTKTGTKSQTSKVLAGQN